MPRELRGRVHVRTAPRRRDPRAGCSWPRPRSSCRPRSACRASGSRRPPRAARSPRRPGVDEQPELAAAALGTARRGRRVPRSARRARPRAEAEGQSFDGLAGELDEPLRRAGHAGAGAAAGGRGDPLADRDWISCDLHMHTSWSHDCSIDAEELLDHAEAEGLGAIAVTDHNVFGGALEAVELARGRDLIVIPGEEVKTDGQGEVIGLFLQRGDPARHVLRRHDRGDPRRRTGSSTSPTRSTGCTRSRTRRRCTGTWPTSTSSRSTTRACCFEGYNDEALRFARKYNLTMGAGSDAHVLQGVGTGRAADARVRRAGGVPDQPADAPRSCAGRSRSRTSSRSSGWPRPRRGSGRGELDPRSRARRADRRDLRAVPEKAIAEINELGDEIAQPPAGACPCIGSGHPLADVFLLKYRPRRPSCRRASRSTAAPGQAILKSLQRLRVDPMAVYGTNCLKFADEDEDDARAVARRASCTSSQPKLVVVMGEEALALPERTRVPALAAGRGAAGRAPALHADGRGARRARHRRLARRAGGEDRASGTHSSRSAPGGPSSRRTRPPAPRSRSGRSSRLLVVVLRGRRVAAERLDLVGRRVARAAC